MFSEAGLSYILSTMVLEGKESFSLPWAFLRPSDTMDLDASPAAARAQPREGEWRTSAVVRQAAPGQWQEWHRSQNDALPNGGPHSPLPFWTSGLWPPNLGRAERPTPQVVNEPSLPKDVTTAGQPPSPGTECWGIPGGPSGPIPERSDPEEVQRCRGFQVLELPQDRGSLLGPPFKPHAQPTLWKEFCSQQIC